MGFYGYFEKKVKKKHRVVVISACCLSVKSLRTSEIYEPQNPRETHDRRSDLQNPQILKTDPL